MVQYKIFALAAIFITQSVVCDNPRYAYPAPSYSPPGPSYHHPPTEYKPKKEPYVFAYGVNDHTGTFGHNEESDGNGAVKGEYRVVLPDGRTQIVTYTADHYSGYNAKVTYEGEAKYHSPSPYKAPHGPPTPYYDKYAPQPYFAE